MSYPVICVGQPSEGVFPNKWTAAPWFTCVQDAIEGQAAVLDVKREGICL